ncbi:MAG: tail fiber domain-containing protein [Desulfobacterales bacterium]|nr:tail fiber domain-containing protein [Desulfobacterales bacterium]
MRKTAVILILWMGICVSFTGQVLGWEEGPSNTLFGDGAGTNLDSSQAATFIGFRAGYANTTGYANTFLGYAAGSYNTSGYYNIFLGYFAGGSNTAGYHNTFLGNYAGYSNTTGYYNTFLGYNAGYANTTGTRNTFLGNYAGYKNTEGASNVFIGYRAGYNETGSNKLYIDNMGTATPLIYGEFDNDLVKIHGTLEMAESLSIISDVRMKKDIQPLESCLNKVSMLAGVSFDWKTEEYSGMGFSNKRQIGLIAQEVEKVVPELVKTGADGYKSLSYAKLTAVLVEAVKELKNENNEFKSQNNAAIEQLKDENKALKAQMKKQQAMLEAILKNRDYSSLSSNSSICMAEGGAQ